MGIVFTMPTPRRFGRHERNRPLRTPAPIPRTQRRRRAQQRRMAIRVLRNMGPPPARPRPNQPSDRRLRRQVQRLPTPQRPRQQRPRRISSRPDGRRDACRPPPHLICREAVQTVDSGERLRKSSDDDGRHCFRGGREAAPRRVCAPVDVVVRGAVPRSGAAACLAAPGRARRRSFRPGAFRPGSFRPGSFPFRTFRRPGRRGLPAGGHALERHPRGVLRAGRCGRAAARLARRCRRRRRKPGRNAADKSASARLTAPGVRGRSPGRISAHASA